MRAMRLLILPEVWLRPAAECKVRRTPHCPSVRAGPVIEAVDRMNTTWDRAARMGPAEPDDCIRRLGVRLQKPQRRPRRGGAL